MRFSVFLSFLCLPVLAGTELAAQNKPEALQEIANKHYRLTGTKMSEDGRWLTIRKSYDLNSDTVLIFSSRHPGEPIGYRTKIGSTFFPDKDHLLLHSPDQAELLNLKEKSSVHFKGVKKIQELKSKKQFVLHYAEEEKSRLELRDANGELLNAVDNASRFYTTERGHIYAITENEKNEFEVILLKDKIKEEVFRTSQKISYLEIDPREEGIMVNEQNPESNSQEVLYLDLKTKAGYPLKEVLPIAAERGFREVISEGNVYFLRLWMHKGQQDSALADIWYGNDNQLEEKFFSPTRELYYVWEPRKNRVQRIGTDKLIKNANIGNEGYFLSFDPYLLQDYTKPAPLKINIYDRLEDRYSLMDTISRELYTSPDGQYALYQKNKIWYVYHLPAGTQKTIGGNGLNTPYFTTDGKMVLFEGDGGLWRYDLAKNGLVQLNNYEGYQVTILNGTSHITLQGFNFFQRTVDLKEPLVLKLYDPHENRSAYLLWENGKSKTIIPSTSRHIQYLKYDNACKHFIYLEENYNMPPRLVYKKMGEEEKVIYQSNKEDKAILSLKQEIISYTNSEGIPLKGILYYPLYYNPSQKYPMVVNIYEVQHHDSNHYLIASLDKNGIGFDIRFLLEKGYFVYLPDIVYGEKGTGLSALDCVNRALDALENNPFIDKSKIGLIGYSHGGFETNFIATHSNRFAAYVSGAGNSDIVRSYFSFNYNFLSPFYWQYENGQYKMNKRFCEDKNLYFQNNPIHYVDQVNAPVLLWAGMKDHNIYWEQTMEFYIGLKRNKRKVIAVFYPNEGHALIKTSVRRDLVCRILDWFDYFLKDQRSADWINMEIKKDAL